MTKFSITRLSGDFPGKKNTESRKGIALLLALTTVLIVTLLANVILSVALSQSRLTHHKASRIQAHYAAMAGINYALEKLRLGNDVNWFIPPPNYTLGLCRNLTVPQCGGVGSIIEPDLPGSIQYVEIRVAAKGTPASADWPACNPAQGITCIDAKATYTYTYTP